MRRIPLSSIRANPFQPRRQFRPDELAELEASLRASGLLQPISVRRRGEAYELIAGERRVRAATNLGWTEIQAIIRDFDDRTMLVLALVENLQRTNLNALEEARGYRRLVDEFQLTQQQVAEAVGKDRTTVTNLLRILALPDEILVLVEQGSLSPGHARALLALGESGSAVPFAQLTVKEALSVRELEQRVRDANAGANPEVVPSAKPSSPPAPKQQSPVLRSIEDDLRRFLQTDVRISTSEANRGKIEISFFSADDLDRVLELILRDNKTHY
ncbi:MAG TPA: ParB/RepB/Spo0J family partition protein [Gemmatimonadaceae bacterium]|nr:ParB/RepB/Spo0J family partition protein [Gemmatimonadaceae bacterium]